MTGTENRSCCELKDVILDIQKGFSFEERVSSLLCGLAETIVDKASTIDEAADIYESAGLTLFKNCNRLWAEKINANTTPNGDIETSK